MHIDEQASITLHNRASQQPAPGKWRDVAYQAAVLKTRMNGQHTQLYIEWLVMVGVQKVTRQQTLATALDIKSSMYSLKV